jgi:hypothetical protein
MFCSDLHLTRLYNHQPPTIYNSERIHPLTSKELLHHHVSYDCPHLWRQPRFWSCHLRALHRRPNHIVIAASHNPSDSNSKGLLSFKTGEGSKSVLVKVDANIYTDAAEALKELETKHSINHIDIVYANAGIETIVPKASDVKVEDLRAQI